MLRMLKLKALQIGYGAFFGCHGQGTFEKPRSCATDPEMKTVTTSVRNEMESSEPRPGYRK